MKEPLVVRRQAALRSSNDHLRSPEAGAGVQLRSEPIAPLKLLRFPVVRERTGLSRSTIWRLERRGAFPKHRRISANVVAWIEEEVNIWIRARAAD